MDFLDKDTWLGIFESISPYISTFEQRQQVIKTFLPDMLDSGYSGNESLSIFREAGLGVGRSTFFSIRREIVNDENLTSALRTLGLDQIVTDSMMRIASREMPTNYFHLAAYAFTDDSGEQTIFGNYGFYTNESMTKGEILEKIAEIIKSKYPEFENELTINLRKSYIDYRV